MEQNRFNLSYASIVRVVIVLSILFVLYLIREVIAILFVSIVFASAIDPFVDWMKKHKIPRGISVLIVYAIALGIVILVVMLMIPPLSQEFTQLVKNFPDFIDKLSDLCSGLSQSASDSANNQAGLTEAMKTISSTLAETSKGVFSTISGIFGSIVSLIVVLVITFYITVEEDALKRFIKFIIPSRNENYIMGLVNRIQIKMGLWLRGQIFLSLIVGLLVYIGLLILGVKYALVLALIAGILEIVPFIGPTIAAIPAVLVGLTDSWIKALVIVALYLVVQQLENHIIVPKVMQKAVGLNPIVVIIVIMVGAKIGGVMGALIAVPVAAAIGVVAGDVMIDQKQNAKGN